MCSTEPSETCVPRPASSADQVPSGEGSGLNITVSIKDYKPQHCHSQQNYVAVEGDTCKSISEKMSVATGTLEILNGLYADCSNLVSGMKL